MPTLEQRDSRRLTGPNLQTSVAGAVLDVHIAGVDGDAVIARWKVHARDALDAVGWKDQRTAVRTFPGGASLVLTVPIDALYAATEVNEWAWAATCADFGGASPSPLEVVAPRLQATIAAERNPAMLALREAARAHGVAFLWDDDQVSVGMGVGSLTWPTHVLPAPSAVDWNGIHDVRVALVTGSNGKTTTVRLLAAMIAQDGQVAGCSNTDGLYVGRDRIDAGDWSGPGGARAILRDRRVEVAVLETARGGLLRRGLMVERADAALLTNVASDHLGEFGVTTVDDIARAKLVIAHAVRASGVLVANADDPVVMRRARDVEVAAHVWFGMTDTMPDDDAAFVADGRFAFRTCGVTEDYGAVADAPITFGGAAQFNTSNILGAIPVARAIGVSSAAIRAAIHHFASTPDANPGRGHLFDLGGVRVFLDFAHNPHGMRAVGEMVQAMPAKRRLVVIGQAGDRSDDDIRDLVRAAITFAPHRVIIKEMRTYLRGRPEGEVAAIIADELDKLGVAEESVARVDDELGALREALAWAREGDLIVLPIHAARDAVIHKVQALQSRGWRPGAAIG